AVEEVVADGEAQRAGRPQTAEAAFEFGPRADLDRFVDRSVLGSADEGGDRRGHADDRSYPARHLLDVDTWIGQLLRHTCPLTIRTGRLADAGGSPRTRPV